MIIVPSFSHRYSAGASHAASPRWRVVGYSFMRRIMKSKAGFTASRCAAVISTVLIRFSAARAVMRGVTAPNCLKIASVCFHMSSSFFVPIRTSMRLGTKTVSPSSPVCAVAVR